MLILDKPLKLNNQLFHFLVLSLAGPLFDLFLRRGDFVTRRARAEPRLDFLGMLLDFLTRRVLCFLWEEVRLNKNCLLSSKYLGNTYLLFTQNNPSHSSQHG